MEKPEIDETCNEAMKKAFIIMVEAFENCELKSHMRAGFIHKSNGKSYELTLKKIA